MRWDAHTSQLLSDERVLRAAEIILNRGVGEIILIGNEEEVKEHYLHLGLDLSKASIVDPANIKLRQRFIHAFYER